MKEIILCFVFGIIGLGFGALSGYFWNTGSQLQNMVKLVSLIAALISIAVPVWGMAKYFIVTPVITEIAKTRTDIMTELAKTREEISNQVSTSTERIIRTTIAASAASSDKSWETFSAEFDKAKQFLGSEKSEKGKEKQPE